MKQLLETFGLPPICFLYVLIIGLLIPRRYRFGHRVLVVIGVAGLTILSLPAVSGSLINALERNLPVTPPSDAMPRAIVILGGDVMRTDRPPFAIPGLLTLERLRAGAALRRQTGLPILVTGGTVQRDRLPVATLMADSLREDFQVPVEWVEAKSADTWQNAELSAEILKRQGITSVYVVTQAWHMPRAVLAFRHAGFTVTAVPTSVSPPLDLIMADFTPHASSWALSFFALHEWIGYAWYAAH